MGRRARKRERERKKKWSHWVALPRTTQARKSKPTIQISCGSKSGPAQRPYVGYAQLASSVGISYKAVVWQGLKQGENVRKTFGRSCQEQIRWVLSKVHMAGTKTKKTWRQGARARRGTIRPRKGVISNTSNGIKRHGAWTARGKGPGDWAVTQISERFQIGSKN